MTALSEGYGEEALIEQPAIALFAELGWQTADCFHETFGEHRTLGRETSAEVVLVRRLQASMRRLNPGLPDDALALAVEELTRDRGAMSPAQANRDVYRLLKDGVKVTTRDDYGDEVTQTVRVIDWDNPSNNDFFLASQLWVSGEIYKRRADLVGFVNGLPFVFVELKAAHKKLEHAYQHNLKDYKSTIPKLFWYNALVILSNGGESKIGSVTAAWEHCAEWKKINGEGEQGVVSQETMIRGTCDRARLLDLVENFTLFSEERGGLVKMVAKNHQYLGVNQAVSALSQVKENQGRLGVFWHTQGSGKSYSMVFFAQKVLRKVPGNYTFLVVTDRQELDDQIYHNFARAGAVTEEQVQAASGEHLKQLLREDHRYVFTLIQKFVTKGGQRYEMLSDRSDIIVITDEAHRSQYDTLAGNMREALPNAAFIAFTGTPLIVGEEKTRDVFGDYVSVYNFKQSIDDGATVPLYYENRIPELQLTNKTLNEDLRRLVEEAELDEAQEKKLERELFREYHLITRDERLEKIAEDIVAHFMARGQQGKAMVVSIDKATAVRMYDKVRRHWQRYREGLEAQRAAAAYHVTSTRARRSSSRKALPKPTLAATSEMLTAKIEYMRETDMAVVVSQAQNEEEEFKQKGLDITVHRKRMVTEHLDEKFKDPDDPFRIVFVCAMWMTGFDVPSCSTIYLDKPMRNHTLMQTIARANRVFHDKLNGLIVDYIGVFRDLQKALAIYGAGPAGSVLPGDAPVKDKSVLVALLREAIASAVAFCAARGVDLAKLQAAQGFERVKLLTDAADSMLVNEETKNKFLSLANGVGKLFQAILPDPVANDLGPTRAAITVIAAKILSLTPDVDISEVLGEITALLDESIATEGYVILERPGEFATGRRVDLSTIDFKALKALFAQGHKHIEVEKLKAVVADNLQRLVRLNKSRADFLQEFQRLIDEYNAGSQNVELFFERLVSFAQQLTAEEQRGIAEQLSEEELAIFDLLTKPAIDLSKREELDVKKVAHDLLETLKREKLVLDWRKRQQSRAAVQVTIKDMLDGLPQPYTRELYEQKCEAVYLHVYDSYFGQGQSIYALAE